MDDYCCQRQDAAAGAARTTQNLTKDFYKDSLTTSLELIYAQFGTLTASIDSTSVTGEAGDSIKGYMPFGYPMRRTISAWDPDPGDGHGTRAGHPVIIQ